MDEELAAFAVAEGQRRGWFDLSTLTLERPADPPGSAEPAPLVVPTQAVAPEPAGDDDAVIARIAAAPTASSIWRAQTHQTAEDADIVDGDPIALGWQHRIEEEQAAHRPEGVVMGTIADRYAAAFGSGVLVVRARPRLSACSVCRRRIRPGHEVCLPCETRAAREAARALEASEEPETDETDQLPDAPPEMNLVAIVVATVLCIGATWWSLRDERTPIPERTQATCVVADDEVVAPDC